MTHFQVAVLHQSAHVFLQGHQAQQVGHGGTGFAYRVGHFLLGQLKFLLQPLQGSGFLDRVEVLALYILNQGHGDSGLVGDIPTTAGMYPAPPAGWRASDALRR